MDLNPINNIYMKHNKALSYVFMEMFHNTMFHFIETIKVRGQARNLVSGDISGYFENNVVKKPLISGVIAGFFGAGCGALSFMTCHNYLTQKLYQYNYEGYDFRAKNMIIYLASDACASLAKIPFETRKQLVQMSNYNIELKIITRNAYYGMMPLMARDVIFRSIILGTYYGTTDIEHKPSLKYSIP